MVKVGDRRRFVKGLPGLPIGSEVLYHVYGGATCRCVVQFIPEIGRVGLMEPGGSWMSGDAFDITVLSLPNQTAPPTTCVYELTGEIRAPKKGEWYWSDAERQFSQTIGDMPKPRAIARCIAVPQVASKRYTVDGREVA